MIQVKLLRADLRPSSISYPSSLSYSSFYNKYMPYETVVTQGLDYLTLCLRNEKFLKTMLSGQTIVLNQR